MTVTQEMKPLDMDESNWTGWLATLGNASIGGNDVAAICGVNPWATPAGVYDRIMRTEDRRLTPAMKRGIMLEPIVANMYEIETGHMLREVSDRFLTTETGVNLRANIDREIMAPGRRRPLEIKVLGQKSYSKLEVEGIPVYYWLQGQHYAYVWGETSWSFAALQPERWELWHKDVPFDRSQYMEALVKVEAFWHDHIVPRIRPGKEIDASVFSPPVTGDKTIIQREDPDWVSAVNVLRSSRNEADRVNTMKKQAEDIVKELMGDDETVVGGGARITWKTARRRKLNEKRLQEALGRDMDLDQFFDVTESRTFRPTFDE